MLPSFPTFHYYMLFMCLLYLFIHISYLEGQEWMWTNFLIQFPQNLSLVLIKGFGGDTKFLLVLLLIK